MRSLAVALLAVMLCSSPALAVDGDRIADGAVTVVDVVQALRAADGTPMRADAGRALRRAAGLGTATVAAPAPRVVATAVDLHLVFDADVPLQGYQVRVNYPLAKGGIEGSADGAVCTSDGDGIFIVNDRDDGTMVLIQANAVALGFPIIVTCRFDQNPGTTLVAGDVTVDVDEVVEDGAAGDPADLRVTIAVGELPVCSTGWVRLGAEPGSVLDVGWTGIAHGTPLSTGSAMTLPIDCAPGSTTCAIDGSAVVGGIAGAPLPISAGGVGVCVLNTFRDGVTGTFDCAGGCVEATVPLLARVFLVSDVWAPCPHCVGDAVPNDGIPGGICELGTTPGGPCDTNGIHPFFGPTSNDCLPTGVDVGELAVDLGPLTTGTTSLAAALDCRSPGFPPGSCHCPDQVQPNACIPDGVCPASGVCENGPLDGVCSLRPFLQCFSGTGTRDCDDIFPGAGTCIEQPRACFPSTITRSGTCGAEGSVVASVSCVPATKAPAVNTVYGLPGPVAVSAPIRAEAAHRPTPAPSPPGPTIEPTPVVNVCDAAPREGCRRVLHPNKATLLFENGRTGVDELAWRWLGGEASPAFLFGDPTFDTRYALCAYAGPLGETSLVLESHAEPELCRDFTSCWRRTPAGGFVYRNAHGNADGLTRVELTPGEDGAPRVVVKGRSAHLTLPSLPLSVPLTVQLQSSAGPCWEATYESGDVKRNDAERFRAVARPSGS